MEYNHMNPGEFVFLEFVPRPQTSTLVWFFQLDDSESLHENGFTQHLLKKVIVQGFR